MLHVQLDALICERGGGIDVTVLTLAGTLATILCRIPSSNLQHQLRPSQSVLSNLRLMGPFVWRLDILARTSVVVFGKASIGGTQRSSWKVHVIVLSTPYLPPTVIIVAGCVVVLSASAVILTTPPFILQH